MFWNKKNKKPEGTDQILELIDQGLIYEDDFIETYGNVVNTPEFMQFFKDDQRDIALEKLNILINESVGHKAALEQIKIKLNS